MNRNFVDKDMSHKLFGEIDLNDVFFDSLKQDYPNFEKWFHSKQKEKAYVQYNDKGALEGFLFLKMEYGIIDDISPSIKADKILKIGTFKVNAHGSKIGERFIKIITDIAISENCDLCYVTIFPKHENLIKLVTKFGFIEYGKKHTNGVLENVYVKNMKEIRKNILQDFPLINTYNVNKYLISIYPKYHTLLFADSILSTENREILKDISYTNSIHKIYVTNMDLKDLKANDILVIYRTKESWGKAEYTSVATSIGVVEEIRSQNDFDNFEDFYKYACQYSVFDKDDLKKWYDKNNECKAIKFTYNVAFKKRITRRDLIENIGLSRNAYWGFFKISDTQFKNIIEFSEINRNIII